ncbi:MAG: hypothetical protein KDA97_06525, partial [Acidimicrobiales bacterium]|nr:hypothetical protein [Acidimicrobiales bacterium]
MTRRRAALAAALVGMAVLAAACTSDGDDGADGTTTTTAVAPLDDLALDEIQVIGTHNSFHQAPPDDELAKLAAL